MSLDIHRRGAEARSNAEKKYKAYPEYKDSGVEWLGAIPSNWRIKKLKFICKVGTGDKDTVNAVEGGKYPFFVRSQTIERINSYGADCEAVLTAGDGVGVGKVFHHYTGKFDFHQRVYMLSSFSDVYGRFVFYYLSNNFYKVALEGNAKSTVDSLRLPQFLNFEFSLPDLVVQKQIANFLDHETAKIDTLIEKQQQLIKLLKEKRQAVISHAVTKGLNPSAPMKDSGIEWLGEVPAHWEISKAKYLFDFITSGSRGWAEFYSDTGSLFFRITNLTRETIEPKLESIQNVNPPKGSEGERSIINSNDLLISITADLGSVCVANEEIANGYVSQHVALCRPNTKVSSSRWLGYFILSNAAKEQFIGSGYGGTKIQLSLEDIRELRIVLPPRIEQQEIENYLDEKLNSFSYLISNAERFIHLLQERRTALISAAVTGKIDIRENKVAIK